MSYEQKVVYNADLIPMCQGCGCLVGDMEQHDVWHRLQDSLTARSTPSAGYEPTTIEMLDSLTATPGPGEVCQHGVPTGVECHQAPCSAPDVGVAIDRSYIKHPAERAIQEAVDRVEEMGGSAELTRVVIRLGALRAQVADYVERNPDGSSKGDGRSARRRGKGAQGASREARRDDDRGGEAVHRDGSVPGPGDEQRSASAGRAEEGSGVGATGSDAPVVDDVGTANEELVEEVIFDAIWYTDPNSKLVLRWSDDRLVVTQREANTVAREIRLSLEAQGWKPDVTSAPSARKEHHEEGSTAPQAGAETASVLPMGGRIGEGTSEARHTDADLAESYRDGWGSGVGLVCVNLGHPVYPNGEGDCACGFFGSTPEVPSVERELLAEAHRLLHLAAITRPSPFTKGELADIMKFHDAYLALPARDSQGLSDG